MMRALSLPIAPLVLLAILSRQFCAASLISKHSVSSSVEIEDLHTSARPSSFSDIAANWDFVESVEGDGTTCPTQIVHSTWTETAEGTASLPHNTITEDGDRCDSTANEKELLFYQSKNYNLTELSLDAIGDAVALPDSMRNVLTSSPINVKVLETNDDFDEAFLMGFESRSRFCGGDSIFKNGSIAFLMRPFSGGLRLLDLETSLAVSSKWLLMVPAFTGDACLYQAEVVVTDDGPDKSPESTPEDAVCFPSDSEVETKDGRVVGIGDVKVGDMVHVGHGKFSRVFGFSHRDLQIQSAFVTLQTESGHSISASHGHFLHANDGVLPASHVKIGDILALGDGCSKVVSIAETWRTGLVNPQTEQGDIVVNGVLATTYTTAVKPSLAHAALAPLRAVGRIIDADLVASIVDHGLRQISGWPLLKHV